MVVGARGGSACSGRLAALWLEGDCEGVLVVTPAIFSCRFAMASIAGAGPGGGWNPGRDGGRDTAGGAMGDAILCGLFLRSSRGGLVWYRAVSSEKHLLMAVSL
jgi:hypothetical protein